MPVAAFAVHQLRYSLAFGSQAQVELQRQGHSYLHSAVPWLVVLIAVAIGVFLRALGRAFAGQRSLSRYTLSFAALWLLCTAGLVAIYVAQEFLEGLLAVGHPAGLAGIFGFGGWWSIPAAVAIGLVLAAVFHGARWVLHEVSERCSQARAQTARRAALIYVPRGIVVPRLAPLADGWSGRGPPH
jgi:cytochrome bd-type quinol oxidase subunit 2